jgi:DMSO/TMAO reductase YedYZ molybdopterin-dependent catalytic subunit
MSEDDDTKLTRTKRKWAAERKFITGRIARPETDRLPPGQHLVKDWPVLDLGQQPNIATERWTLDVDGAVETPAHWDWAALMKLPQSQFVTDIHCVTTWSRYDNRWQGIATQDVLDVVMPKLAATHVMLHSYDGYTTNVPLEDFAAPDAILAHTWEGKPLTREHGGPLRLVIPHLYFWKSAKWLKRIEFMSADKRGFWEDNGYHDRGDPWTEQRYQCD